MTLLDDVVATLRAANIAHAVIGAAALGAYGVARSTADIDLLTTDPQSLTRSTWSALESSCHVDVRRGDLDDPLSGVIRVSRSGEPDVDVVVGKCAWQTTCVERAQALDPSCPYRALSLTSRNISARPNTPAFPLIDDWSTRATR